MVANVREAINGLNEEFTFIKTFSHASGIESSLFKMACHLECLTGYAKNDLLPNSVRGLD
jgi:hypothetical protein